MFFILIYYVENCNIFLPKKEKGNFPFLNYSYFRTFFLIKIIPIPKTAIADIEIIIQGVICLFSPVGGVIVTSSALS